MKRMPWTEEEDGLLKSLFGKMTCREMQEHFTERTAGAINIRCGHLKLSNSNRFWKLEEDDILRKYYLEDDFERKIKVFLPNRDYNAIKARANFLGMKRVTLPDKNDNFFAEQNMNSAVVSGFFSADGCVSNGRFSITISKKDLGHLKSIKKLLKFSGNIRLFKTKPMPVPKNDKLYEFEGCSIEFANCQKIIKDLNDIWGITERKTHTIKAPKIQDLKIALAFISGVIDGDGWICLHKAPSARHGKQLGISVMGTKSMMSWIKNVFDHLTPLSAETKLLKTRTCGIYSYKLTGARAYLIGKLMLKLNIIRLDRKWNRVKEFIQLVENEELNHIFKFNLRNTGFNHSLYDSIMDYHQLPAFLNVENDPRPIKC